MTKWSNIAIAAGIFLVAIRLYEMEWSVESLNILLVGVLIGVILSSVVVWWRKRK